MESFQRRVLSGLGLLAFRQPGALRPWFWWVQWLTLVAQLGGGYVVLIFEDTTWLLLRCQRKV